MSLTLTFYDEIRAGDAEHVLVQLREQPNAGVTVRINSPGGSVAAGLAIFNALKPRKPTVWIDGVAASIASLIAMAGDQIIAAENALLMIHDPWTETLGNAATLRRTADLLDKHRDAMLRAYTRTGLSESRLLELLAAETWMNAEEALRLGFVDQVAEALRYAAHAPACFAGYHNTPKELLMPNATGTPAAALPPANTNSHASAAAPALAPSAVDPQGRAVQALRDRNECIVSMAAPHMGNERIRGYTLQAMVDPSVSVEAFGQRVLAMLGEGREPLNGGGGMFASGGAPVGGDFVQAASDALALRAGITLANPHPGARDVAGMSLREIMQACVTRGGRHAEEFGRHSGAVVRAALTTSDFPTILENTLGKALRAGFEVEPATYEAWTRRVLVADFKPQARVLLGSAPDLLPVAEGGEYVYGAMDEDKSLPYSVGKFGRLVKFTWEALVNDDLSAFLRVTQAMGQAARRAEGDQVYATFAENSGAGPAMQDGVNLFHVGHGNLTASATGVTADALGGARVQLRRQTALGGGVLNLTPRFLLVAPEQEQDAEALLAAAARNISQGSDNTLVPAWLAKLELVVEARLSGDAFYLLTAPDTIDTVERAWLELDNGPVVQEEDSFGTDARAYKVRHVFGARWLDWRGAVKVPLT